MQLLIFRIGWLALMILAGSNCAATPPPGSAAGGGAAVARGAEPLELVRPQAPRDAAGGAPEAVSARSAERDADAARWLPATAPAWPYSMRMDASWQDDEARLGRLVIEGAGGEIVITGEPGERFGWRRRFIADVDHDSQSDLEVFGFRRTERGHVVVSTTLVRSSDLGVDRAWKSDALHRPIVLRGDVNADGVVGERDVRRLLSVLGSRRAAAPLAGLDFDGLVTMSDLRATLERYGDNADKVRTQPLSAPIDAIARAPTDDGDARRPSNRDERPPASGREPSDALRSEMPFTWGICTVLFWNCVCFGSDCCLFDKLCLESFCDDASTNDGEPMDEQDNDGGLLRPENLYSTGEGSPNSEGEQTGRDNPCGDRLVAIEQCDSEQTQVFLLRGDGEPTVASFSAIVDPVEGSLEWNWSGEAALGETAGPQTTLSATTAHTGVISVVHTIDDESCGTGCTISFVEVTARVDANRDGAIDEADEETVEAFSADGLNVGAIVMVNDNDSDGDGLPNVADGLAGENLRSNADRDPTGSTTFLPLEICLEGIRAADLGKIKIRLEYDESDPSDVVIDANPDRTYSVEHPPGRVRLWTGDAGPGGVNRDPASVQSGGSFVVSGHTYRVGDFRPSEGVIRLWIEGVRPSEARGDAAITIDLPEHGFTKTIPLTAIGTQYVELLEGDTLGDPIRNPPVSHPTPTIDLATASVTNARASKAGDAILVDVQIGGSVDDAASDMIDGVAGSVHEIGVLLNAKAVIPEGATEPARLPVSVQKQFNADAIRTRYDFTGAFAGTLTLPVLPGSNTLTLTATNAYGFTGYAEFSFDVEAVKPKVELEVDFRGQDPYDADPGSTPLPIDVEFLIDDGDGGLENWTLDPSPKPGVWTVEHPTIGGFIEVRVSKDTVSPTSHDVLDIVVNHPEHNVTLEPSLVIETTPDSLVFTGRVAPPSSWGEYALSVGPASPVEASAGGPVRPLVTELLGPDVVAELIGDVSVGDPSDPTAYVVTSFEGRLFLGSPTGPCGQLVIDWNPAEPIDYEDGDWLGGDRWGFGNYMLGFGRGMVDSGVSFVDGVKQLGQATWYLVKEYNAVTLLIRVYRGDTEIYIEDARRVAAAVDLATDVVETVGTVIWEVASTEAELGLALLASDDERITELSEEHRAMMEIAAEVLDAIWAEIDALDDYEKGRLVGIVVGTITVEAVAVAATGAASAALKSTVLARALPKIRANSVVAKHDDVVTAIDGVTDFVAELVTTKMCFAPGTPVWTIDGLRPIESIAPADLVLARDPDTGAQGWKRVLRTFTTRPATMLRIEFVRSPDVSDEGAAADEDRAPGDAPPTSISPGFDDRVDELHCTPTHPFHSQSRGDFVLAGDLVVGEELFLADSTTAYVTDIQVQRGPPSAAGGFTAHNLEVADWHTYFAGESGVWVHNEGPACQRAFSIIRRLANRQGQGSWGALKSVLDDSARPGLLAKIRPVLPQVAREATIEALREALRPDGSVDLARIQTFRQIKNYRATMPGMALKARVTGLENHHLVPRRVSRLLGVPEAEWDDSPAILLLRAEHQAAAGGSVASFHRILDRRLAGVGDLADRRRVLDALLDAYDEFGLQGARPGVNAFLDSKGLLPE